MHRKRTRVTKKKHRSTRRKRGGATPSIPAKMADPSNQHLKNMQASMTQGMNALQNLTKTMAQKGGGAPAPLGYSSFDSSPGGDQGGAGWMERTVGTLAQQTQGVMNNPVDDNSVQFLQGAHPFAYRQSGGKNSKSKSKSKSKKYIKNMPQLRQNQQQQQM